MADQNTHSTPFKTTCGGQALIEGILMQGPAKRAIVVRKPDGELDITEEPIKPRSGFAKLPFIRGIFIFCGSLVHGMKALMHSAELSDDGSMEGEELTGLDKWITERTHRGMVFQTSPMSPVSAVGRRMNSPTERRCQSPPPG